MSSEPSKPRRIVHPRRVLALGATAAVLGAAAEAAPMTSIWAGAQSLVRQVAAEGEGEAAGSGLQEAEGGDAIESEGEGASAGGEGQGASAADAEAEGEAGRSPEAEGEGEGSSAEGEGEGAAVSREGESEGGGRGPAPAVAQSRGLLVVDGLLRAAEALRDAGEAGADALIEEAAETAEHQTDGALTGELPEAIEGLEGAATADGFDAVRRRIAAAQAKLDAADRLEALPMALRTAAEDYAAAVPDDAVADRTEYLEAFGIFRAVRTELEALTGVDDADAADIARKMLGLLDEAEAAFDGPSGEAIATPDASLLYGAAARMELLALKLR